MAEEGEDKRDDINKLERLFEFLLLKADERLTRMLLPPLKDSLIWSALVRGWTAGRILTHKEGGRIVPNYQSLDPRWLKYDMGKDSPLWTAYTTQRSREALEDEYKVKIAGKSIFNFWSKDRDNIEVIDYWRDEGENSKVNSVIANGIYLKDPKEYKLKSMPTLIIPVATRPPVVSTDSAEDIAGYGESIFAPNRDLNGIKNRFLSIVATHANMMANQSLINYKGTDGKSIPPGGTMNVPGGIVELTLNENKLEASPMKDVSPTVIDILGVLNAGVRKAMLPDITIDKPPPSGTLFGLVTEQGNKIFNPQLKNLDAFYAGTCRLIEEQLVAEGISLKIQGEKEGKYFELEVTPVDLKRAHIIEVTHTARTPWEQLEVAQLGDMLKRQGFPDMWLREHLYKIQNPKGMDDMAAVEIATHSPIQIMRTAIETLYNTGQKDRADTLVAEMRAMVEQMQAPEGTPPPGGQV